MTHDSDNIWYALQVEAQALGDVRTTQLFERDSERAADFSLEAAGLFLDYSKNHLSRDAIKLLVALAEQRKLPAAIAALLRGEPVNTTENRAALHTALRDRSGRKVMVDDTDACALAAAQRERVLTFAAAVHNGQRLGSTGKPLTTVVNIGIGGSDLGPQMVVEGLRPFWLAGRRSYFVSNVDGQHLADTLEMLDWETTLFVVASKTFTTEETMTNARSAQDWFYRNGAPVEAIASHFVALSTNAEAVRSFGITDECTFGFWDWVGGRFSLWSSIGLSIALQVGGDNFLALLDGAHAMDEHFRFAPIARNMPVLLALVGVWNRNIQNHSVHAVLPYDQHLHRLPAYLQQADMESNGKSVGHDGGSVKHKTGPVVFGEPGTNGQHAFYQLLHQGTDRMSADFIAAARSHAELGDHHQKLLANLLAQPRALMCGKSLQVVQAELENSLGDADRAASLAPHKVFSGDRPSNTILMRQLTPQTLGALVALYEHKIYCQGVIWGVNSFDQWGVELGKQLAREILPLIDNHRVPEAQVESLDASTRNLLDWLNAQRMDR
ncbi:MAG: glucose-6-phosphate isomerase [Congregibacter sp.]